MNKRLVISAKQHVFFPHVSLSQFESHFEYHFEPKFEYHFEPKFEYQVKILCLYLESCFLYII